LGQLGPSGLHVEQIGLHGGVDRLLGAPVDPPPDRRRRDMMTS
jgi:hypothetical protein